MIKAVKCLIAALLVVSLSACMTTNEDIGTITGGAVGALVGSTVGSGTGQVLAIAGGTVAGALIGGHIGRYMDAQDRLMMNSALESTADGQEKAWRNPNTHRQYRVVPTKTYYHTTSQYRQPCRRYVTTAIIDGRAEKITGTACRRPNGTWKVRT